MPLFQPKIIEKVLARQKIAIIPAGHLQILEEWKSSIDSGSLAKQTEVAIHAPFTHKIMVEVLGYKPFGGGAWSISREYGVASGAVDLALGHFSDDKSSDRVIAPFELKGAKTTNLDAIMAGRHKTPVQQAWDYARDIKGAQWVLLCNYVEMRLYAVSETSLVYEQFNLAQLTEPRAYARFILLLHADNLLTGRTAQLLNQSQQADKEITAHLYRDYKSLRETLISRLIADNPAHTPHSLIAPAQKLLDRLLFAAFAEDKGLIPENSIRQAFEHADPYNPRPVYENFKGLFRAIDRGNQQLNIPAYNGGLFAADAMLEQLIVADELCHAVNELAGYDFDSEVSVTVLGHIFEQSISDLEELSDNIGKGELPVMRSAPAAKAVTGKRKRQGVVYTPDHITAFIVEHTLGRHIEERFELLLEDYGKFKKNDSIQWKRGKQTELKFWYAWQQDLQSIRVVDPACGSGAFLVAAFDHLSAEYQRTNDRLAEITGQHSVFDLNKTILNNNLYGVDINPESIEISKLSLWLKTAQRGKPLTALDANLVSGDSLGFDQQTPGSNFCWQDAFPEIMQQGGFDLVLGNPPYVRQERFSGLKPWLEQHYQVYHGVADLYAYFFELGLKLLKPQGRMGYISSSTFFKTGSGEPLRRYLMQQAMLEKVVDFGDLQLFEGVTTYPAILVLQKATATSDHKLEILQLRDQLPDNLGQHFVQQQGRMAQQQLSEQSWQLEDEKLAALRSKLTTGHPTLKEVYGSPYRGVLTGLNAAFVIDRETRDRLIEEDAGSAELLKPFLEGKDLKKWHAQPRDLWLIAIPKFWTRQQMCKPADEPLAEESAWRWFQSSYPAITGWLTPFAERARKRTDKGEFWWELRACTYYEDFAKPKIFYPEFSVAPLFHLDTNSLFSNNKGFFIPFDDYYLLGLLNSRLMWLYLTGICTFVRGGYYELRAIKVATASVPHATDQQRETIASLAQQIQSLSEQRYQLEASFRRRLPDLCPPEREPKLNKKLLNWWLLDFTQLQTAIKTAFKITIPLAERNDWQDYFEAEQHKIADLNQQIQQLEQQLDQAVYKLFDLTPEEIELLQQNL